MACSTLTQSAILAVLTIFVINSVTSYAVSSVTGLAYTQPIYSNLYRQALSNERTCFSYSQKDHFAKDCPTMVKINKVLLTQEDNNELKKEEF